MQAARRLDDFHAGADVEMVGVAQQNLCSHFAQFARVQRLDARLSPHRHEDGRFDYSMRGVDQAGARAGIGALGFEFETHYFTVSNCAFEYAGKAAERQL